MVDRKNERPERGQDRANKPDRIRLGAQYRDKLTVKGLDPDFAYYWALDTSEVGGEITKMKISGWDFESADRVTIGQPYVYKTEDVGSLVRVPAGDNDDRYLYLMRKPKEWHEEDQAADQAEIDRTDAALQVNIPKNNADPKTGSYGMISFDNAMKVRG